MNGSVQQLDISDNPIGQLGIKAIAELLTPSFNPVQSLTELSLNKCDILDPTGIVLAKALRTNRTLRELHLSRNQLSDATAAAFGQMLQANGYLERLDLSWNNIKVKADDSFAAVQLMSTQLPAYGSKFTRCPPAVSEPACFTSAARPSVPVQAEGDLGKHQGACSALYAAMQLPIEQLTAIAQASSPVLDEQFNGCICQESFQSQQRLLQLAAILGSGLVGHCNTYSLAADKIKAQSVATGDLQCDSVSCSPQLDR